MTINEVKISLNRKVRYNGADNYIMTACVLRRNIKTGNFFYQAELMDRRCNNSLVYCRLEDVHRCGRTGGDTDAE